ncbi:MAG: glycoside hydrolase family 3 N-terminal domain-containing protein [Pyrinomonadaceae bacterium]
MSFSLDSIRSLPLAQKIGQLFFIGIPGPELDETTKKITDEISPGGVCLFARNIKTPMQTRDLLDGLRGSLPVEPFLSVDQEGGLVDRLKRIISAMPAANKIRTKNEAERMGSLIAEALCILGFNMNFAPVVDVIDSHRTQVSNGLFSRAFGCSAQETVELAGSFLIALQNGGCLGCLKHFPGLGASKVDSHEELPKVDISSTVLESVDLYPYKRLLASATPASVMVAHACYPDIDLQEKDQNGKLLPSSLSKNVVSGLLRNDLGFDGLTITDDLEMGAIIKTYGIGEACKMAVNAGVDMLSICAGVDSIYQGFAAVNAAVANDEITEARLDESLRRIAAAKSKLSKPPVFDPFRLESLSDDIAEINARLN